MPGIDLGTCNSGIAYIKQGRPQVVRPDPRSEVMPSVVFMDPRGVTTVGLQARVAMMTAETEAEGSGHDRWKPYIGQDHRYHFAAAKQTKTGPQLSALVIQELLGAYRRETGQELTSCVITIPAKFDQASNDATREAARLSGLQHSPTIKEPIAAALAYGFTSGDNRANWLVFDLGGGTLDVCLMAMREGNLSVLQDGQAGDQHLGGTNFDRALLDFILGPSSNDRLKMDRYRTLQRDYAPLRTQYKLDSFSEKTKTAWNRLLLAVEDAKMELSTRNETVVQVKGPLCTDEQGKEVFVEVPVTRAAYEKLIAADIERAVNVCQMVLSKNRMTAKDLDQIILIGGPTKTPYLQQVLQERLKVDLDIRIDPMTAVALGAALHAETLDVPGEEVKRVSAGSVSVDLQYEKSSRQPICTLGGVLHASTPTHGWSVEISRLDGNWSSGRIPVDESGFFTADLQLEERGAAHQSVFETMVFNEMGRLMARLEEPKIWYPFQKVDGTLTNTIGVALAGNKVRTLLDHGQRLPSKSQTIVRTTQPVRRGSADDLLRIPVVEAVTNILGDEDREHADATMRIGELVVKGDNDRLRLDLPKGTEIQLTVAIDESQLITVTAYVERLDDEFTITWTAKSLPVPIEELEVRFQREKDRLAEVREVHQAQPDPSVAEALDAMDREKTLEAIEAELERVRAGERGSDHIANKRILQLAGTINHCWTKQAYPRMLRRLERIRQGATGTDVADVDKLQQAVQAAGPAAASSELDKLESESNDLDLKIRFAPFFRLVVYVLAIQGKRVDSRQYQVHGDAMEFASKLIKAGAPGTLTAADLREIESWNDRMRSAFPDLMQHVEEYERNRDVSVSLMQSYGSTIE